MSRSNTVILALGALGLSLLLVKHWVHALGFLPYLILLACPVMHLFHRHRGSHDHTHSGSDRKAGTA